MRRRKESYSLGPRETKSAEPSDTRGVTRRSFLTNVATAGIAATASPLLRATPHTIELPQAPAVSNPAGTIPVELKINGQIHQLQIESRVTLLDALARIMAETTSEGQRRVLLEQAEMINRACERSVPEAADRADIQRRYEVVLTVESRLTASGRNT